MEYKRNLRVGVEGYTDDELSLDVYGNVNVSGNISVAGTVTYDDVSNVDSIGLVTARSGIVIGYPGIAATLTANGNAVFSGIVTAAQFFGDGSGLDGVTGVNIVAQEVTEDPVYPTFASNVGVTTLGIAQTEFVYINSTGSVGIGSTQPTAKLDVNGTVNVTGAADFNGDVDVDGHTELDDVNVSGVSTFTGAADFNGDIDVDGHTELDDLNVSGVTTTSGLLDINAGGQANTFKVEDLTDNRVVIAGTGGELEDDANLTFNGTQLAVGVDLDVDGHTELDDVNVSGASTFTGAADFNGDVDVDGHTELDDVNVTGVITATSFSGDGSNLTDVIAAGIGSTSNINTTGIITASSFFGDGSNLTGIQPRSIAFSLIF